MFDIYSDIQNEILGYLASLLKPFFWSSLFALVLTV